MAFTRRARRGAAAASVHAVRRAFVVVEQKVPQIRVPRVVGVSLADCCDSKLIFSYIFVGGGHTTPVSGISFPPSLPPSMPCSFQINCNWKVVCQWPQKSQGPYISRVRSLFCLSCRSAQT